MKLKSTVFAIALAITALAGANAHAQWGFGIGGLGYGGLGLGYAYGNPYVAGRIPTPPYYAIHPPVYYGQRVHRAYGRSPFARSAQTATAAYSAPAPRMVINKHVADAQHASVSTAKPQLVLNPFVEQPGIAVTAPEIIENPHVAPPTQLITSR